MSETKQTALILEGGALRGVYTSGVLDVLMLHHVKIPNVVGIYPCLNGLFYVSGQIGNAAELNLNVPDSRYMGCSGLPPERNLLQALTLCSGISFMISFRLILRRFMIQTSGSGPV